ncbi:MAG: TIGR03960 family B12-binding radical SAM protein [Oscillospiraceae bacterium]|nr:TIGR03960 family B12-binding radical SAM protein [Oscillospiraceae bacterium]
MRHIEQLLPLVQKPGRYTGGEPGSVMKNSAEVALRMAFCFPDVYEIGMSHLGLKILYGLANAREDCWCERAFAPWVDMEAEMRRTGVPLCALESGDPLRNFDLLGFTLQYELCYSNVLNMLDLAGLPLRESERDDDMPVVIAGGPCTCNPAPLAPFIDLFVIGEGEEVLGELLDLLAVHKRKKSAFLQAAAQLEGCYVPGISQGVVKKRIVQNMNSCYFPETFPVPLIETVHDRTVGEVFRGCIRGCRFCQAGFITRPVREKSPELISEQCRMVTENTGYDEVSLCSLSTSDYTQLPQLLDNLLDWTAEQKVNVAAPSLRADEFPEHLMERLAKLRRSGLTFAPEAGTQRLRDVINKNITQEQMLTTATRAFSAGWTQIKLYFMLGLPTETDEDIQGIAALAQAIVEAYYANPNKPAGKGVTVTVSASNFVPKPHTPFQWETQANGEEIRRKQQLLRNSVKSKKISVKTHDCETSLLEGVFARGDEKLADVLEAAWAAGARFDGWDDQFKPQLWRDCFAQLGIDPDDYLQAREIEEPLPWHNFDYGVSKKFLLREREQAHAAQTTPNCREACAGCGVGTKCSFLKKRTKKL